MLCKQYKCIIGKKSYAVIFVAMNIFYILVYLYFFKPFYYKTCVKKSCLYLAAIIVKFNLLNMY